MPLRRLLEFILGSVQWLRPYFDKKAMSKHRFLNVQFPKHQNEIFRTDSTILKPSHYEPIILFVGTFNGDSVKGNTADFFYGRNYFWPVWRNLFSLTRPSPEPKGMRRFHMAEIPLMGGESSIYHMCRRGMMTFADLVVHVDDQLESHSDGLLKKAAREGRITWATKEIIHYLGQTPSIRFICSTCQMDDVEPWSEQWNEITRAISTRDVVMTRIHTPSGQGLSGPRRESLASNWLESLPKAYLSEIGLDKN